MARLSSSLLVLVSVTAPLAAQTSLEGRVDSVFRQYTSTETPGCVVGAAQRGRVLLERAFGMADLERSVALTPSSILEAGSVSKQFTAAAVLLLARDGKLSLDDPVRRWVPELPEIMQPITLRHMVHHMSGLRDWGSIAGIGGWPRNSRALDHRVVLQIIGRMRELNFPPGTEYEYSNSNYNLLAIVAERASGESLPAFTKRRIFDPLGMTSTSWRDDAMRVVRNRALSYDKDSEWHGERAVENIYGNCCLLTTVGDLLKWNAAFDSTRLGGAGFRAEQERRGVLKNGQAIDYAAGLFVGTWRGQHWVGHSGATSGYRANLVRYTDAGVSVAVLCNRGDADPEGMSDSVAGALVPFGARDTANSPVRVSVPAAALADKAGLYRNLRDMRAQRLRVRDGKLENENGIELVPIDRAGTTFQAARGGMKIVFARRPDGHYNARTASRTADTVAVDWVADADTGRAALAAYAGQYESPEAETTVRVALDSTGSLAMTRLSGTPGGPWPMKPIYRDGFEMVPGVPVFTRDSGGKIDGFRFTTGRVRNLRFNRSAP
ncbi:MAG TPA: serine hydrolase domain-containing protein [Gemmatimonadales bacterium]|nr:serine hydrolase domain-containing protein [Gemmatimonadales bacterium]